MTNKKKKCKIPSCDTMTYGTLCGYHKNKKQIHKKNNKAKPVKKTPTVVSPKAKLKRKVKDKKPKATRIGIFKKNAWDVFSLYIRLEDSNANGIVKCISCERSGFFYDDNIDAGHFQSRRFTSTFLHRNNVSGQCKLCNGQMSGQQYAHGKALDVKWGIGTADSMEKLAKTTLQLRAIDYISIIRECIKKCEQLLSIKDIDKEVFNKIVSRLEYYKRFVIKENNKITSN